jgi:hypothetical protein
MYVYQNADNALWFYSKEIKGRENQ